MFKKVALSRLLFFAVIFSVSQVAICRAQSTSPADPNFNPRTISGMKLLVDGKPWTINQVSHDGDYSSRHNIYIHCKEGLLELVVAYHTEKTVAGAISSSSKNHKAQATLRVEEGAKRYDSIYVIGDDRPLPPRYGPDGVGPVWLIFSKLEYDSPFQVACALKLYDDNNNVVKVVLATTGLYGSTANASDK